MSQQLAAPSDSESNVSGLVHYNNASYQGMYDAALENMESIHHDLLLIQNNLKYLLSRVSPLESKVKALLQSLPNPRLYNTMETNENE